MAMAASSIEANWTMAAPLPVPLVSGMIRDLTIVSPRSKKVFCKVAWSIVGGRPVM